MSHFSVMIITKNEPDYSQIEDILAPFDENIEVPEYIAKTKKEIIEEFKEKIIEQMKRKKEYEKNHENIRFNKDWYDRCFAPYESALKENDEVSLYAGGVDYFDLSENIDSDGNYLSTYNPKSKWDWWQLGGRFSGAINEESDVIQRKDFPHINMPNEKELIKQYSESYNDWKEMIKNGDGFYKPEYFRKRYKTFTDYMQQTLSPSTYAVIDIDGNWHENGEAGWFGTTSATPEEEIDWDKNFYDNFIKDIPDGWWLTVVDCHI